MPAGFSTRAALIGAVLTSGFASAAAPVTIDSEQKANAAVYTALRVLQEPKHDFGLITDYTRGIAENALLQLAAATTPATLMNARNGVTLACANSGYLTARMARSFPRVLKVRWQACRYVDLDSNPHERNGSMDIVLVADSFTPQKVAALRFGTASDDFTDTRHIDDIDQVTDEKRSANLRMVGIIPMTRAFPLYGLFVGDFAFELTGFYQEFSHIELPGSGVPPYEATSRVTPEFVIASGRTSYSNSNTLLLEDLKLLHGRVTHTAISPPPYGETTRGYSVDGLRIRAESDFVTFADQQLIDGKIDYHYLPAQGGSTGCLSGGYAFVTRVPLAHPGLNYGTPAAGKLLINGSTTVQFFSAANAPTTLPTPQLGMLTHLEVRDVGSFNYDSADASIFGLNALCNL